MQLKSKSQWGDCHHASNHISRSTVISWTLWQIEHAVVHSAVIHAGTLLPRERASTRQLTIQTIANLTVGTKLVVDSSIDSSVDSSVALTLLVCNRTSSNNNTRLTNALRVVWTELKNSGVQDVTLALLVSSGARSKSGAGGAETLLI